MTASEKKKVFEAARMIAAILGPDFVGRVEINLSRGGVGSVHVVEVIRE